MCRHLDAKVRRLAEVHNGYTCPAPPLILDQRRDGKPAIFLNPLAGDTPLFKWPPQKPLFGAFPTYWVGSHFAVSDL